MASKPNSYSLPRQNLPLLRSIGDGLEAVYSDLTGLKCEDPTLAQQQFKDDCNLNAIMERYQRTGELTHFTDTAAMYGDFTHLPDLRESLDIINAANATFNALPAKLRARFENDPKLFVDFASNSANRDEMKNLGLLKPDVPPAGESAPQSATSPAGGLPPKASPNSSKKGTSARSTPSTEVGGQGDD